jgi:hypothetical protein
LPPRPVFRIEERIDLRACQGKISQILKDSKKRRFPRAVKPEDELLRFWPEIEIYETPMIVYSDACEHLV